MKSKFAKFLEYAAIIIAIIIAVITVKNLNIESMLRGKEEPVTSAMTESLLSEDIIGMPAADDIPRIEDVQEWEDTWQTSYVTIEPLSIIPTGYGTRHPWVSAYSTGRRGRIRNRPVVSEMAFDILDEYGEYFLVELPDGSYILAQMSADDAGKIKSGKQFALPIGHKSAANGTVLANISDLCEEYDVYTDGVFYCINDAWNESHSLTIQLIRIGAGILTTLVLGTIFITIIDKIFKVKD